MKLFRVKNIETGEEKYFTNKTKAAAYIGTSTAWMDLKIYHHKTIKDKYTIDYDDFEDILNKNILG